MATIAQLTQQLNSLDNQLIKNKAHLEQLIELQMKLKNPSLKINTDFQSTLNREIGLMEHRNRLLTEFNNLQRQAKATVNTNTGYIPGGAAAKIEPKAPIADPLDKMDLGSETSGRAARQKRMEDRQKEIDQLKRERQAWLDTNKAVLEYAKAQGIANPAKAYKSSLLGGATGAYDIHTFKEKNAMGEFNTLKIRADKQGGLSSLQPQKSQQSFAQGITKDLGDLMKWSIAIAAVYGPINAASEALATMIENEAKLADVSIALNDELATTNQVFDDVYDSAKSSGEEVSGVVDAFGAAFTAAGRVENQYQRYDTAVKLLNDSLVLSKLSTLDQAGAIDVLTAALYQSANSPDPAQALSRGTELIDKWIRVSQVASVSVETLATGVAVLGDSAETAGLDLEHLNAFIATISEVSLAGGKEAANVAKALIGGYQTQTAVKELNRLGIAVTDSTGKTRQYLDVMKDVSALRVSGLLGDEDFNKLTLALGGGGVRRQKDVAAFVENFGRMEQIVGLQEGAGEESATALAKKLDTVQTSSTRLGNSFESLAQTLGNEGGLLDVFSGAIDLSTSLVEALDKVAGAVGKVGPLLLGAGFAGLLMRGRGGAAGLQNMIMNNTGMGGMAAGLLTGNVNPIQAAQRGLGFNPSSAFGPASMLGRATSVPSMAAIALPAIQNLASGDAEEAGANIAGGITGALVGGPIGALIGSAIAEAFVRTTMTYEKQFADLFKGSIDYSKKAAEDVAGGTLSKEDLMRMGYEKIGGGSEALGSMRAWFEKQKNPGGQRFGPKTGTQFATEGAAMLDILKNEDPELYNQIIAEYAASGGNPTGVETRLSTRQKELTTPETTSYLRSLQQDRQDELQKELLTGKLKPSDYSDRMSNLSAFTVTATRYMAALEDQVGGVGDAFSSSEDAYTSFLNILSSGNQESIQQINSYIASIDQLQNLLDNMTNETKVDFVNPVTGQAVTGAGKDLVSQVLEDAKQTLAQTTNFADQQARLNRLKVPDVYGGNVTPTKAPEIDMVIAEAQKVQKRRYAQLSDEDYAALVESFEPFVQLAEEAGKVFYKQIEKSGEKLDKGIYGEVFQKMQEEGKISKPGEGTPWSVLDATAAQVKRAESLAPGYVKKLEEQGYQADITDAIYTTSDEQIVKAKGDQKVIQFLLQQILDTEKKQLEGVYNLPENASMYVPFQGYKLGQMEGGSVLDSLTPVTSAGATTEVDKSMIPGEELGGKLSEIIKIDKILKGDEYARPDSYIPGEELGPRGTDVLNLRPTSVGGSEPKDTGVYEPTAMGSLEGLISKFMELFNRLGGIGMPSGLGGEKMIPMSAGQESANMTTKLDVKFDSTTNLMVDGRVLASIVKPYLAADLLKTNETGGTVTRSYVI